jgi:putative flavoprotein involved in K+ transport
MPETTAVIVGAGQAGLAASHCLSAAGVDHIVIERGRIAERWRSQSWDSLRLLTPNWMTRLPGFSYDGSDPDGFMSASDLVAFFERYAARSRASVMTGTTVLRVERHLDRFRVETDRGIWQTRAVVVATGYCDVPAVPQVARRFDRSITQMVPAEYRRPADLPPGHVLVVGASATGIQLADEIQHAGRKVTLAVGRHLRLPRRYRGRDILWWFDRLGILTAGVYSLDVSRHQPSLQLVGRTDHASIDLGTLHASGVRLAGHLVDVDGTRVSLADDLVATMAAADVKLAEIRLRIDRHIEEYGLDAAAPEPFRPTWPLAMNAPSSLDLAAADIGIVIWATGYRRQYPWLAVPVLDRRGEIVHDAGRTAVPDLFVLGLNFQQRRNSSFIDGVGADACAIAQEIAASCAATRVA